MVADGKGWGRSRRPRERPPFRRPSFAQVRARSGTAPPEPRTEDRGPRRPPRPASRPPHREPTRPVNRPPATPAPNTSSDRTASPEQPTTEHATKQRHMTENDENDHGTPPKRRLAPLLSRSCRRDAGSSRKGRNLVLQIYSFVLDAVVLSDGLQCGSCTGPIPACSCRRPSLHRDRDSAVLNILPRTVAGVFCSAEAQVPFLLMLELPLAKNAGLERSPVDACKVNQHPPPSSI